MTVLQKYVIGLMLLTCFAFEYSNSTAQKVGLVLSGGGSRGVAHIGVIKALEENNIPVDCIAGTSMGAIIGGLYACGYTPGEIEEIFTSGDIQSWVRGGIDPQYKYYFKQPGPNASWQIFKVTYDSILRAKVRTNLISPFEMDYAFMSIFAGPGAAANYNFDSLFIPFRCVASDIVENKPMIIRDGDVGQAVRASMTFPFYFKPIRIDGKLVFDGGMYNNFPVDIVKKDFKPDVIIGSKAASNYDPPKDDDLISQLQSMLMEKTEYSIPQDSGILIEPSLKSTSLVDLSNTQAFIDSGYRATIRKIDEIKALIGRSVDSTHRNAERRRFRSRIKPLHVGEILINGLNEDQVSYVNRIFKRNKYYKRLKKNKGIDNKLTLEGIKPEYFKLIAEDKVEFVYPKLIYRKPDNLYDMSLDVTKANKVVAELGGLVSSRAINEIFTQLSFNAWGRNALSLVGNAYLGRFYNSGQCRARIDIPSKLPFYFETSYTYNNWNYFKTSTYFFEDVKPSYLLQTDNYWNFNLSVPVTRQGKFVTVFGTGRKRDEYYQTNHFSRLDTTDQTTFDFVSPGVFVEFNSLNRKQFASNGMFLKLCIRYINGIEKNKPGSTSANKTEYSSFHEWLRLRFLYDNYFHTVGPLKLGFYGEATISNQTLFNNYTASVLSAPVFQPIPESKTLFLPEFRAHNYAAFGMKNIISLYNNIDFRLEGYVFQPFQEILREDDNTAEYGEELSQRYYIASAQLVYHSPLGPASICLNYYDQSDEPFSFHINLGFLIFNKRPFE